MTERTFSIVKPDATRRNLTGAINAKIEAAGLRIVAQKRVWLSRAQAEKFYEVHKERPFYNDLVRFMTSGPAVPMALERENANYSGGDISAGANHLGQLLFRPFFQASPYRTPLRGVAPGQTMVLYRRDPDGDEVIGSATIAR